MELRYLLWYISPPVAAALEAQVVVSTIRLATRLAGLARRLHRRATIRIALARSAWKHFLGKEPAEASSSASSFDAGQGGEP